MRISAPGFLIAFPTVTCYYYHFFFFKGLFILERAHKLEGQRKRERESLKQTVLSKEPDVGLDPTTLRS